MSEVKRLGYYDYKCIDGLWYERATDSEIFWKLCRFVTYTEVSNGPTKQDDQGKPHIVCDCGEKSFYLRFKPYELHAKCQKCGKEEIVYDG